MTVSQKTFSFFLSPSNEKSAFWRSPSLLLFRPEMFSSLFHSKSRSRQSPGELSFFQALECRKNSCWFHTFNKKKERLRGQGRKRYGLFVTLWHHLKLTPTYEFALGIIRICITVWNTSGKKNSRRQEGDLSLWLWLIQARGSTLRIVSHIVFTTAKPSHNNAWQNWWITITSRPSTDQISSLAQKKYLPNVFGQIQMFRILMYEYIKYYGV